MLFIAAFGRNEAYQVFGKASMMWKCFEYGTYTRNAMMPMMWNHHMPRSTATTPASLSPAYKGTSHWLIGNEPAGM